MGGLEGGDSPNGTRLSKRKGGNQRDLWFGLAESLGAPAKTGWVEGSRFGKELKGNS